MTPNYEPSGTGNALASTSNDAKIESEQTQQPKSRLSYRIYMHCQQLRKRKLSFIHTADTKFHLTYELIANTIQRGPQCPREDLDIARRENIFQSNLLREMNKFKAAEKKQLAKSYKKHYKKYQKQVQQKQEEDIMASLQTQSPTQHFTFNPQPLRNDNDNTVAEDNERGTYV